MINDNIKMLRDTLRILEQGSYEVNDRTVNLKLSGEEMEAVHVLLPQEVEETCRCLDFKKANLTGRCEYDCVNMDSFGAAIRQYNELGYVPGEGKKPVLVLNLANPVQPGGGVRRGARAQEEDLCRKSSLLLSLESGGGAKYYEYNQGLHTFMGSDALIITPQVEIIRDDKGELLDETVIVAVLTCAAPMITYGKEGLTEEAYQTMVFNRIMGMLKCAAYFGYENLVLGAWGCGAFRNGAHVFSDLFYKALTELDANGLGEKDLFCRIDFAVLDRTPEKYNYSEFWRNFGNGNFYKGV